MPEDPLLQASVDELFEKKLSEQSMYLHDFASYISPEKMHDLVSRFLTTEMKICFHYFLPYLDDTDLKKIGRKLVEKDCINGLTFEKALPFLDSFVKEEIKAWQNI